MNKDYMLDASGSSAEAVNRSLGSKKGELTKKLGEPVEPVRRVFTATYNFTGDDKGKTMPTAFTVRSEEDWEALNRQAIATAGGRDLGSYGVRFGVQEFYALSGEQMKKVVGEKERPTAGISPRAMPGSLDRLTGFGRSTYA